MVNTIVQLSKQPRIINSPFEDAVIITIGENVEAADKSNADGNNASECSPTTASYQLKLGSNHSCHPQTHPPNIFFCLLNSVCCCLLWLPLPALLWALLSLIISSFVLFVAFSYLLYSSSLVALALGTFLLTVLLFVATLILSVTLMIREELEEEEEKKITRLNSCNYSDGSDGISGSGHRRLSLEDIFFQHRPSTTVHDEVLI